VPAPEREHRFLLTLADAHAFLIGIAAHVDADVYDPDAPVAYARTTYFDTDDAVLLRSCLAGTRARRLRIREYAAARTSADVPRATGVRTLELKESSGSWRHKRRAPLDERTARAVFGCGPRALLGIDRGIDLLLRYPSLAPRLTTWYRRASFTASGVRVTVDDDLAYCAPAPSCAPGDAARPTRVVSRARCSILELKTWGARPAWLVAALAMLPAEASYSKFCAGMAALGAPERTPANGLEKPAGRISIACARV
jgi:hypothetical protein